MERVASGESVVDIADDLGAAASTLRELYINRTELYFRDEANNDRVNTALEDVRPLNEPTAEPDGNLNERFERFEQKVESLDWTQGLLTVLSLFRSRFYQFSRISTGLVDLI